MDINQDLLDKSPSELRGKGCKVIRYIPDLTAFEQQVQNHYSEIIFQIVSGNVMIVDFQSYKLYCLGVLRTFASIHLQPLYAVSNTICYDLRTLTELSLGEDLSVECWLLDICKEICRPMIARNVILIPIIPAARNGERGDLPKEFLGLGLDASQARLVRLSLRRVFASWDGCLEERNLMEERVSSAPLTMRVGNQHFTLDLHFISNKTTPQRISWWYKLGHLFNGIAAKALSKSFDPLHCINRGVPWIPIRERVSSIEVSPTNIVHYGGNPPQVHDYQWPSILESIVRAETASFRGCESLFLFGNEDYSGDEFHEYDPIDCLIPQPN